MNVLNYAAAAGITALIVYLMVIGNAILLPLVTAVFVWYLINALATATRVLRVGGKPLPKALRLGAAILVLSITSWFVLNMVIGNIAQVVAATPVYEENLRIFTERAVERIGLEPVLRMQALVQGLNLSSAVRSIARAAVGLIGSIGTVAIYVAFLLLEQHSFDKKIAALCPNPAREALLRRILTRIGSETQTYVLLKTLTSLLTGFASYVVMKIVGLDYAAFWALLIFALNYIPYIGALSGVVFPTLLALVQFDTFTPFVITTISLTVVQFVIGSILEPRIMGKGLNLSPVIMLLSLVVWGTIWGVAGMFLAVPLMVVVMIVFSNFESTRPIAILMSASGELQN